MTDPAPTREQLLEQLTRPETRTVLDPDAVVDAITDLVKRAVDQTTAVADLAERVGKLEKPPVTTPPPREVPANHVRYEDLAANGETLVDVIGKVPAGKVLNLPAGTYELVDFRPAAGQPYVAGLTVPTSCGGIVGAGRDATVIRMREKSSTQAARVPAQAKAPATNPLYLIQAAGGTGQLFAGFHLEGTDQGHLYGGLALASATQPMVGDVLVTGIPGDRNAPPGETFGINVWKGSGMVGVRVEVDGRRRSDGARVGGAPIGFNSTTATLLVDPYLHDCLCSTLTYWETTNSRTERVRIERNGTGPQAGYQYAHGINHERSGGIEHVDPTILIDQKDNPTGYHMTWNSDVAPTGGLTVRNPKVSVDQRVPDGRMVVMTFKSYRGVANTLSTVKPVVLDSAGKPMAYAAAT